MPAIEVNMNPDDINRMVVDAILKSTLGAAVKEEVDKAVAALSVSWNNPLTKVIEREVSSMISKILNTDYHDVLKAKVQAALEGKITDEFVSKVCAKAFDLER